jgi:hypothetical protein
MEDCEIIPVVKLCAMSCIECTRAKHHAFLTSAPDEASG